MKKLILTIVLVLGMATSGWAITFTVDGTSLADGRDQAATAEVNIVDDTLSITLANTGTVTGISSTLTGFSFTFSSAPSSITLIDALLSSGKEVTISKTGHPAVYSADENPVAVGSPYSWGFDGTLLAAGDGAFKNYGIVNDSILDPVNYVQDGLSNGPHNPYLLGPVTFNFTLDGLLPGAEITSVAFYFGTGGETQTPPSVPEPGTMVLLGTGLVGLAFFGRKRMNK